MRYPRVGCPVCEDTPDKENLDPLMESYSPRNKKKISKRLNVLRDITERYKSSGACSEEEGGESVVQEDNELDAMFSKLADSPVRSKNIREI
jgi:hypothetical protein